MRNNMFWLPRFVLYYFIIILCKVFDFGGCSVEICLLYCIVFICFVSVLHVFSDKFLVRLLYDRICGPTKCVCVCVCVCMYVCMYINVTEHGLICDLEKVQE